jgi:hypothetical protein
MHDRGFAEVSLIPCSGFVRRSGQFPCSAGVAQLVEHLFCKQAVGGSSPFASSKFLFDDVSEGCPSGQREQAVNLPDYSYVGSNPTPSTGFCVPLEGRSAARASISFAGVAQLVERQPSKLNVEGSNPFSRSSSPDVAGSKDGAVARNVEGVLGRFAACATFRTRAIRRVSGTPPTGRSVSPVSNPFSRSSFAELCSSSLAPASGRSSFLASDVWFVAGGRRRARSGAGLWQTQAHIAQMVERVLGKDEVTSSILVVGSN